MSLVWDLDMMAGEKLVLLALADQANDEGVQCWPSIRTIARRSCQGERTVRRLIHSLERAGHLTIHPREGTSSHYHIHPGQNGSPANLAPRPKKTQTPAKMAGKPLRETPSIVVKRAREKIVMPGWLPVDAWNGFLDMRKEKGAVPTGRATQLLIAKLERLRSDGNDPGAVLDQSTENNWSGIFEVKANGRNQNIRAGNGSGSGQRDNRDGIAKALDRRLAELDGPTGAAGRYDDAPASNIRIITDARIPG